MSCPKCGYSGHNTVSHWGTGEIECENCRHDYVPVKKSKEKSSGLSLPSARIATSDKVHFPLHFGKLPEPMDMSSFAPPISWAQKVGHAEFRYPEPDINNRY